jgi:hypothetical protein
LKPGDAAFLPDALQLHGCWGSIGVPVFDGDSGKTLVLSAAHVAGALNRCWHQDVVVFTSQASPPDQASPRTRVGRPLRSIPATLTSPCDVDAVTIEPRASLSLSRDIGGRGAALHVVRDLTEEDIGVPLYKRGWATGETSGACYEVEASVRLTVRDAPKEEAVYDRLIGIMGDHGAFAAPGDSGAAVVDDLNQLVGLLVGMDSDLAYCTPMSLVLEALGAIP